MAIIWLKLCVQILIQVNFVGKRVKAVTIITIVIDQLHCDFIRTLLQHVAVQDNFTITEVVSNGKRGQWLVVYDQIGNISAKEINEDRLLVSLWHLLEIECYGCFAEVRSSLRQRELNIVGDV